MKNPEEKYVDNIQDEIDSNGPEDLGAGCCQDNIENVPLGTDTLDR